MMMPMMTPKSPNALPKISTTKILTNRVEFWASDRAALLPTTPTEILHRHKHVNPDATPISSQAAWYSNSLPTGQVRPACCQARSQYCISSSVCSCRPQAIGQLVNTVYLCLKDDCHNHTIDGHSLAENDAATPFWLRHQRLCCVSVES